MKDTIWLMQHLRENARLMIMDGDDAAVIAEGWLAAHPFDDEYEFADEDWLKSIGFGKIEFGTPAKVGFSIDGPTCDCFLLCPFDISSDIGPIRHYQPRGYGDADNQYWFEMTPVRFRGEVRTLCRMCNIPLKETV